MGYFPAFLTLENKKILIVGGGRIAYEKLDHLLDFTHSVKVIATEFSEPMRVRLDNESLEWEQRAYQKGDLSGFMMVVVAVDDIALQAAIFKESKQYHCLCNAVDSVDYCDFIFPSYVKKDDLTIAISTSGASPAMAKHLKRYVQEMMPDDIVAFLREMKALRQTLPKGAERMKMLDAKAADYMKQWSKRYDY